jgi:hypothetical protein
VEIVGRFDYGEKRGSCFSEVFGYLLRIGVFIFWSVDPLSDFIFQSFALAFRMRPCDDQGHKLRFKSLEVFDVVISVFHDSVFGG